jgi:HEPN domain-containing protein
MKPLTAEWVSKAEEDFAGAVQMKRQTMPNLICFHCQQCAEKYLKARLYEAGIEFSKTHDLLNLLKLVSPAEPLWESARASLRQLNEYAIEFRYPGENATPEEAASAVKHCTSFRLLARHTLGLDKPPQPPLQVREKKATYRTRKRKK